jgi:hypothetical protein
VKAPDDNDLARAKKLDPTGGIALLPTVQPDSFGTTRISDIEAAGAPKFRIEGVLLDEACSINGGLPKGLKSFFNLYADVHIALGRSFFGHTVKQGRVLIYNAEDRAALTRYRVDGICRALDVDVRDLDLHLLNAPALFIDNPEHVTRLRRDVERIKPDHLNLDPLRNLHNFDENDSRIVPTVLAPLRLIQRELGCSVQVVHHLIKDGEGRSPMSRLRGTGALRGWYDTGWIFDRDEGTGHVKAVIEHRGAESPEPFTFKLCKAPHADGEAFWFELVESEPIDPTLEEKVLAFKQANPGMPGRRAMEALRKQLGKLGADAFWRAWNGR